MKSSPEPAHSSLFAHRSRTPLRRAVLLGLACLGALVFPCSEAPASDELLNGLSLLQRGYLFEEQLDAPKLLAKAINYTALKVPELRAQQDGSGAWRLRTNHCELQLEPGPEFSSFSELSDSLEAIVRLLETCDAEIPEKELPPPALVLQGVMAELDPYTTVLDGRRGTEHTIQYRGKLAGIGARIGIRDDALTLISVYRDSPAYKAGLRDDDVVLRIDDLSAANILVSDAVERIRGEAGSVVVLLIDREGQDEPTPVSVTRGVVRIPSVTSFALDDGVLYAEITHFSQTTPLDFEAQVSELLSENPDARGVIIDLRRNSGGSMLGSAAIGDLFLPEGVLIRTSGRNGLPTPGLTGEVLALPDTPFVHLPVAFLSSGQTASGSELLAASLRNNDRAIVMGERSYGKGTVQKTFTIGEEATLKMTVGHFLPNGIPIPGGGLIPDIEMRLFREHEERVLIPFEKWAMDLPFWLRYPSWAGTPPTRAAVIIDIAQPAAPKTDLEDEGEAEAEEKAAEKKDTVHLQSRTDDPKPDSSKDPTLALAIDLLSNYGRTSAAEMMAAAAEFLTERSAQSDLELVELFTTHGVDWSGANMVASGDAPSQGEQRAVSDTLSMTVTTTDRVKAGEETELSITLHNAGALAQHRVRGIASASSGALRRSGVAFGKIPAGGSVTQTIPLATAESTHTGRIGITLELFDDSGELGLLGPAALPVEGGPRPLLSLRWKRTLNDDGSFAIILEVANRGDADLEGVRGRLENPLSGQFEILAGNAVIEKLEAGAMTTLDFQVRPSPDAEADTAIKLLIGEAKFGTFLEPTIQLFEGPDQSEWLAAPQITVLGTRSTAAGGQEIVFEARDPLGIVEASLHAEESKTDYVAAAAPGSPVVHLKAPWEPEAGLKTYVLRAKNQAGISGFFRVGL